MCCRITKDVTHTNTHMHTINHQSVNILPTYLAGSNRTHLNVNKELSLSSLIAMLFKYLTHSYFINQYTKICGVENHYYTQRKNKQSLLAVRANIDSLRFFKRGNLWMSAVSSRERCLYPLRRKKDTVWGRGVKNWIQINRERSHGLAIRHVIY